MKKRIIEIIAHKECLLLMVDLMQKTSTKKSELKELYKNEIEIKAQISILRHLLD
jgi:hypothetical protein